jgi:tetratricopeptide (TPR) repeat protein
MRARTPLTDDMMDLIEHDNARARNLLHGLVAETPQSIEARYLLAQSYLRSMEVAEALPLYQAVLERDPSIVEARHAIGYCRFVLGDNDGALLAYRDAFAKASTAHALAMCALILHRLNRFDQAIDAYDKLLMSCQPTSLVVPSALQGMAAALRDANRPITAERYTHELIQRFRRDPATIALQLADRSNSLDFHEWWIYENKARLAAALQRVAAREANAGRFPETFVLPQQRDALADFAARHKPNPVMIAKPSQGTGGQGIVVTGEVGAIIDRTDIVVQRYLDRPYLVNGRKGHARIYGLICSAQPLRAYLYSEGIIRFAPERYDARPEQWANNAMHVTNTALHRGHKALTISDDPSQENVGHIWSLTALLRRMTEDGLDGDATFGKITTLVEWFVRMLANEGLFTRQAQSGPARAFTPKLFGLDVLIDDSGNPWLLEMQVKPAMAGAPLVGKINGALFATIFRMSVGQLIEDGMKPDQLTNIVFDTGARFRRELDIEIANRGRFVPLKVD